MTALGPMAQAVAQSLEAAQIPPTDAGAVRLACRYAELLDEAAAAAKYRAWLRAVGAALDPSDQPAKDALQQISDALGQHTVASDLGPKLLSALTALGLTAAGRNARGGGQGAPVVDDELAELRRRAARRQAGAG